MFFTMGNTVETVYQYRQLLGRCATGSGLDFDEIDTLNEIEHQLPSQPSLDMKTWRLALPTTEVVRAVLRGPRLDDDVMVVNLGPGGCVCRHAPYADEGITVELVFEHADNAISHRFKATVTWIDDDGDDFALGLEFVGVPLQVRYGTSNAARANDDLVAA